jgi:hypothetical protein
MMAHLVDFPDLQQKLYGLCLLSQNQFEAPSTGAWLVSLLMGFDADVTPSRGCLALGRRAIRARPQFGPRFPSPGGQHIRSKARVVRRGVPGGRYTLLGKSALVKGLRSHTSNRVSRNPPVLVIGRLAFTPLLINSNIRDVG